jgi:peptidoglycan/xylan/chitin deacetylase (PgdA/CDA1 family)
LQAENVKNGDVSASMKIRRGLLLSAVLVTALGSAVVTTKQTAAPAYKVATRVATAKVAVARPTDLPPADYVVFSPPPPPVHVTPGESLVVPILMYHYIRINPVATDKLGFGLSVTPDDFAAQMTYLHDAGAHTVTLAQVMSALDGGPALPPRPVVLTFDDGHDDFATQAVPIMRRYGFVGTDYVVPGFLGHTSYMTSAQVQQVDALGMVVGAHTVHHVALATVPPAVAAAEIDGSKQLLEQLLGHPVLDFAYPYGSYDPAVVALAKAAGFRDAVTTYSGDVQYAASPYVLGRFKVGGGENIATFAGQALLPPPPGGWHAPAAAQLLTVTATPPPPVPSPTSTPSALAAFIQDISPL